MNGLSRGRAAAILCAVALSHAALATWWMRDQGFLARPAPPEAATQRFTAVRYADAIGRDGFAATALAAWTVPSHHTDLVPFTTACLGLLLGDPECGPVPQWSTDVLFGFVLAVGAYRLARRFLPRGPALLCAALALWAPALHSYQRVYYWQYPMSALLLWTLEALIRSDGLRRWKWCALFGAAFAAATHAKNVAPLYVPVSCATALVVGLRADRRRALGGLAVAVGVYAALVLPWFVAALPHFRQYTTSALGTTEYALPELAGRWNPARWAYYPTHFVNGGVGPVFAAAALAALAYLGVRRLARDRSADAASAPSKATRAAGPALLGDTVLCYAVVTYGQAVGASQYMQLFAAHAGLAVAAAVAAARGGVARVLFRGAAAASLAYCAWVGLRPFESDAACARWGPFEFGGTTDHWISDQARRGKALPRAEAEPWPVEAVAAKIAELTPPGERLVYAELHRYVNHGNLSVVLRRRGVALDLAQVTEPRPGALFVIDPPVVPPEFAEQMLGLAGLRSEEVASYPVLPGRVLSLRRIAAK
jgi:hypothetical protein